MYGIFNDNFPPVLDGVAMTAKNYADWLARKGEDVCVVTPYAPGMARTDYPVYTYPSLPLVMRPPYRLGVPQIDYNFRRQLYSLPFSLVHAHCPFTSGTLALKVARKHHIPIVATFHSKYRQDFERAVPSKLVVDAMVRHVVSFYEHVDEVWIPQAAVEHTLREYGYQGRVTVVDNGNDFVTSTAERERLRREMRSRLGLGKKDGMLLFVGQHIWEKNIALTLEAMAYLKDEPCHLYMVGTGYAVDGIRQKIAELGISDKVTLAGVVSDRNKLRAYYAAADLFLFPSLYDTDGIVIHEAAALGTPSVLMAGSTAANNITDHENGFLTHNDPQEYAALVSWLLAHPEVIRNVGERALHTIARTWDDVVEEVIERYKEITARYAAG